MMTKKRFRILFLVSLFCLFSLIWSKPVRLLASDLSPARELVNTDEEGGSYYQLTDTEYELYFRDGENLLSDEEEEDLLDAMMPVAEYGSAAFVTGQIEQSDYMEGAKDLMHSLFPESPSCLIFMIDMNHRQLIIFSDGDINKTITKNYANSITDNVYRMARDGDYHGCAVEVFRQIHTLLSGGKIAQPMKHITNAMLAFILSALLLYFFSRINSLKIKASSGEILAIIGAASAFSNAKTTYNHRSKSYNPRSRSSGGGSSGGGGGGGGSGGSHGF